MSIKSRRQVRDPQTGEISNRVRAFRAMFKVSVEDMALIVSR